MKLASNEIARIQKNTNRHLGITLKLLKMKAEYGDELEIKLMFLSLDWNIIEESDNITISSIVEVREIIPRRHRPKQNLLKDNYPVLNRLIKDRNTIEKMGEY